MSNNSQLSSNSNVAEFLDKVFTRNQKKIKSSNIHSTIVVDHSEKQIMEGIEMKDKTSSKKSYSELEPKLYLMK